MWWNKKLPSFDNIKHLVANIISIDDYNLDNDDANYITSVMYKYFISSCDYIIESKSARQYKAILGANIECKATMPEIDKYNFKSGKAKEVFEFQKRISKVISMNKLEGVELVMFSSILKGQGNILMKQFQDDLIKMNINKFYLFTDSKCNYKWYLSNGFKLEKVLPIKTSDLKTIQSHIPKNYNVMIFTKDVI